METKYKKQPPKQYIIIHCSHTTPDEHIGVPELDRQHRMQCKLSIGYHFVICRDGIIQDGRPMSRAGNHCDGYDHISLGICMVGGKDKSTGKPSNNFTQCQFKELKWLLNALAVDHSNAQVVGHKQLHPSKSCPAFSVQAWLLKNGLAKLANN